MLKVVLIFSIMVVIFCIIMAILSSKEEPKENGGKTRGGKGRAVLSREEALFKVEETKNRAGMYFFGLLMAFFVAILVLGTSLWRIDPRLGMAVVLVLLIGSAVLLLSGMEKIPSNQQGVKIFLGLARRSIESGPRVKIPGLEVIQRVPRTIFRIDKVMAEVMTKNGKVLMEMSLYVSFGGTEENLLQAVHYLPLNILTGFSRLSEIEEGDISEENRKRETNITREIEGALGSFLAPIVESAVKDLAAKSTWQKINGEKKGFAKEVCQELILAPVIDLSGISDNVSLRINSLVPDGVITASVNEAEAATHKILSAKRQEEAQGERLRQERLQMEEFVRTIRGIRPDISTEEALRLFFINKFMEEKMGQDSKFNFVSSDLTNLVDSILKRG